MLPGDKRLLHLTLPKDAKFWFAFVNQNGVWPWREGRADSHPARAAVARRRGDAGLAFLQQPDRRAPEARTLDLQLLAPKFDLPLENITWHVYLNEKWKLKKWTGSLQMQEEQVVSRGDGGGRAELSARRSQPAAGRRRRPPSRCSRLATARFNRAIRSRRRRAFESAFGLSQHDNAFNEDARVQLHNLKLQQALVGLNVRKSSSPPASPMRSRESCATSAEARKPTTRSRTRSRSSTAIVADENAALMRCAERLIQQQDAAVTNPATIQASIPEQGRLLTFSRSGRGGQLGRLANRPRSARGESRGLARPAAHPCRHGALAGCDHAGDTRLPSQSASTRLRRLDSKKPSGTCAAADRR